MVEKLQRLDNTSFLTGATSENWALTKHRLVSHWDDTVVPCAKPSTELHHNRVCLCLRSLCRAQTRGLLADGADGPLGTRIESCAWHQDLGFCGSWAKSLGFGVQGPSLQGMVAPWTAQASGMHVDELVQLALGLPELHGKCQEFLELATGPMPGNGSGGSCCPAALNPKP